MSISLSHRPRIGLHTPVNFVTLARDSWTVLPFFQNNGPRTKIIQKNDFVGQILRARPLLTFEVECVDSYKEHQTKTELRDAAFCVTM